jgi:mating pheromone alpha-factor
MHKRSADAEADPEAEADWNFTPWRPWGLPAGKRDADAEAEYFAAMHKRSADAEADPEAEADWNFTPWRPWGLPAGKRGLEFRA